MDEWLRALLRGKLELPVSTQERSRADQIARLRRLVGGFALLLMVLLAAALYGTGTTVTTGVALVVLGGIPLGFVAVMYPLFYFTLLRGVRDDGDHPRKFHADERGMSIERASGARIGAPWREWRYEGYIYGTVKHQRFVKALEVSLAGEKFRIEFARIPRSHQLGRAILRGLTS